ncbi:glycosyltransferase [Alkalibacterium psychrotolerans]
MPAISIIMPVYNSSKYLNKAINSVLYQTFEDYELIIIDDGSKDNSLSIIEDYALADSRIKVMTQPNKGPSSARNKGLEAASGQYVYFIDSDDEVSDSLLAKSIEKINENFPDVLMFGMCIEEVGRNEEIKSKIITKASKGMYTSENFSNLTVDNDFHDLLGFTTNKLYKRDVLTHYNIKFDEEIHYLEDMFFNKKVFKCVNNFEIIDDCLYYYKRRKRTSGANTFQNKFFDLQMEAVRARKELLEDWEFERIKIETEVANLHMLAIKATCSVLFKQTNNLTFKEKCMYIDQVLQNPLTANRMKHYSASTTGDKMLKFIVNQKQVYTLAILSAVFSVPYKYLY